MVDDGNFVLNIAFASLLQEKDRPDATEEVLFKIEQLGKLEVPSMISVVNFRERVFKELIAGKNNAAAKAILAADQMRVRNPKN